MSVQVWRSLVEIWEHMWCGPILFPKAMGLYFSGTPSMTSTRQNLEGFWYLFHSVNNKLWSRRNPGRLLSVGILARGDRCLWILLLQWIGRTMDDFEGTVHMWRSQQYMASSLCRSFVCFLTFLNFWPPHYFWYFNDMVKIQTQLGFWLEQWLCF